MAVNVYIVYYSMYGHVERLAEEIKKGADSVEGVEAKLWQVPETLTSEELGEMRANVKSNVPIITPRELREADGFVFGFPIRLGMMAAQFKAFLDSTGDLWKYKLAGKPAGIFFSTGCQGGGQETAALTTIPQLVHHGMLFVPIGYTFGAEMFEMGELKGGSPYGAGTFAGNGGLREPTEIELRQAFHQGKYIATITKKLKQAAQCCTMCSIK